MLEIFLKNITETAEDALLHQRLWQKYFYFNPFLYSASFVVVTAVVLNMTRETIKLVSKRPKSINGPIFPIIGSFLHLFWNRNDLPIYFRKLVGQYGPVLRLEFFGKNIVLLNDPALIKTLLMSNEPGHVQKPDYFYRVAFTDTLADGMVSAKPDIWKPHRSILSKAFTYEALKSYLPIINQHAHKFVVESDNLLRGTDFHDSMRHLSFSIISHIVTGMDMISDKECSSFYQCFHRAEEISAHRLFRPWLVGPFWKFHPMKKEQDDCIDNLTAQIQLLLASQRKVATMTEIRSLMNVMMDAGMTDREILIQMASFLIAGHDTVSISLNFLMSNLALHPNHQAECRKEVDNLLSNSTGISSEITMESLSKLKYLERCIYESMRMYPTIPLVCRELGSTLKLGEWGDLEAGTTVAVCPWTLHRSPQYFNRPDTFDPERFLPENCKTRSSYSYIPFLLGPRNCIGWKMALIEMKIVASYILRHFEIHTSNNQNDLERVKFNIVLTTDKKIDLIFKRRK